MRLPRPLADLCCLAYDLVTSPREVLLVRRHHQWTGPAWIAALSAPALFGYRPDMVPALIVLTVGGFSWALDLVGTAAHIAWQRGRIWPDITCGCCDPDDGPDDDPGPPTGPDDPGGYGLTPADEQWLHSLGTTTAHTA